MFNEHNTKPEKFEDYIDMLGMSDVDLNDIKNTLSKVINEKEKLVTITNEKESEIFRDNYGYDKKLNNFILNRDLAILIYVVYYYIKNYKNITNVTVWLKSILDEIYFSDNITKEKGVNCFNHLFDNDIKEYSDNVEYLLENEEYIKQGDIFFGQRNILKYISLIWSFIKSKTDKLREKDFSDFNKGFELYNNNQLIKNINKLINGEKKKIKQSLELGFDRKIIFKKCYIYRDNESIIFSFMNIKRNILISEIKTDDDIYYFLLDCSLIMYNNFKIFNTVIGDYILCYSNLDDTIGTADEEKKFMLVCNGINIDIDGKINYLFHIYSGYDDNFDDLTLDETKDKINGLSNIFEKDRVTVLKVLEIFEKNQVNIHNNKDYFIKKQWL